jgi:hypothetical protein
MDFRELLLQLERAIASGSMSESDANFIARTRTRGQAADLNQLRTLAAGEGRIAEVQRGPSLPERISGAAASVNEAARQHPMFSGGLLTERGREDIAATTLGGLRGVRNMTGQGLAAILDAVGVDGLAELLRDETVRAADLGKEPERFPVEQRNPLLSGGAEATGAGATIFTPFMGAARLGGLLARGRGLGLGAQLGAEAAGTAPLAGLLAAGDPELSFFPGADPGTRAAREAGIDLVIGALAPIFVSLRRGGKTAIKAFEDAGLKQVFKPDDALFLLPDGTAMGFEGARNRASLALHPEFARKLGTSLDELLAAGVVRVRPEANASFIGFQRGADLTPAQRTYIEDVPVSNPDDTIILDSGVLTGGTAVDIPPADHGRVKRIVREHSPPVRESDTVGGDPREQTLERLRTEEGRAAEVVPPRPEFEIPDDVGIPSSLDLDAVDPQTRADILTLRERGLRFFPAFFDEQSGTTVATGTTHFAFAVEDPVRAARFEAGDVGADGYFDMVTGRFLNRGQTEDIVQAMGESSFVRRAEGATEAIPSAQARADIERHAISQAEPGAAREGVPRQLIQPNEMDAAVLRSTQESGGATFDPRTGENAAGRDLFAISRGEKFERPFEQPFTENDLAQFRADFADELAEPGAFLGTWIDPQTGLSEINVTDGRQSLDEAVRLGRDRNQKSIAHLADPAIGEPMSFPSLDDDIGLAFYRARMDEVVPERRERKIQEFFDTMDPEDAVRFENLGTTADQGSIMRRVLRNFSLIGSPKRGHVVALIGAENQMWYDESASAVRQMFGDDSPRFAAVLASTSPQTGVEENMELALGFWRAWDRAGRPTDPEILTPLINDTARFLQEQGLKVDPGTVRNNLTTSFTAGDDVLLDPATYAPSAGGRGFLSGMKVDGFTANLVTSIQGQHMRDRILRADRRLTSDTHHKRGHGLDTAGDLSVSQLMAQEAWDRRVADELSGITGRVVLPKEAQAMEWAVYRAISDRLGTGSARRGKTYSEVVEELIGTGDAFGHLRADIAETPSFASILHNDRYDPYLTDLGIDAPTPLPRTIDEGLRSLPENIRPADVDNYLREVGARMDAAGQGGLDKLDQSLLGLAAIAATLGGMTAAGDETDPFALAAGAGVLGLPIRGAWKNIARRLAEQGGVSLNTMQWARQNGVGLAPILTFMSERPDATADEVLGALNRMGVGVHGSENGQALAASIAGDMQGMRVRRQQAIESGVGAEGVIVEQNDLFRNPRRITETEITGTDPEGALEALPRGFVLAGERPSDFNRHRTLFGGSVEGKFGQRVPVEGKFEPALRSGLLRPRLEVGGMGPNFVDREVLEATGTHAGRPRVLGTPQEETGQVGLKGLLGQLRAAAEESTLPRDTRLLFDRAGTTGGAVFRRVDLPLFPVEGRAGTFVPRDFRGLFDPKPRL